VLIGHLNDAGSLKEMHCSVHFRFSFLLLHVGLHVYMLLLLLVVVANKDICYSAYMLGNSGHLDVLTSRRTSVTRVDQSKTVEARIMQLSPQGSPMTLVFPRWTSPRNP